MVTTAERLAKLETKQEAMGTDILEIKDGVNHIKEEIQKINGKPFENEKMIQDIIEDVDPVVRDYEDRCSAKTEFRRYIVEVLIIMTGAAILFLAGYLWSLI